MSMGCCQQLRVKQFLSYHHCTAEVFAAADGLENVPVRSMKMCSVVDVMV